MSQREEIAALREEVAELRKQLSALAVSIVELAANRPVQYAPYWVQPYTPQPLSPRYPYYYTWTSPNSAGQASMTIHSSPQGDWTAN